MPEQPIRFQTTTSFKLKNPGRISKWLVSVADHEKKRIDSLSYVFCSDAFLLGLNKKYLKHSTYTDILSFDFSEDQGISGEIYISVPRVRANAKIYDQAFDEELRRVIVHGLLHFCGYQDKSPQQKLRMRRKEQACLSLWK